MNLISIAIVAASAVTGLAGAGVVYELVTVERPETSAAAPAAEGEGRQADRPVRWKKCEPPAVREGRACVTEETRLVMIGGTTSVGSGTSGRGALDDDVRFDDDGDEAFDDHDDDDAFDDHDEGDDDDHEDADDHDEDDHDEDDEDDHDEDDDD